jgi:hypothetical protein
MEKGQTQKVSTLSVIAREEGIMPWEWITDKTRLEDRPATFEDPAQYARIMQKAYRRDKWLPQPTHVCVWSEKDTIEGAIRPVLDRYEVPFQVLHGWSGATPIWDASQAHLERSQDTLIIYVGDYDPSGLYMSEEDLPQRLARYLSTTPELKDPDPEWVRDYLASLCLTIRRVALTVEDTRALGRGLGFPAADKKGTEKKKGDSRYDWFVVNHGDWCWELDALAPNILRAWVANAILAAIDQELWDRYVGVEQVERQYFIELFQSWGSNSGPVQE